MKPVTQIGPESHQVEGPSERAGRITLLVRAAANGNQSAWEGLVNEFSRVVLGVARSHRLSEADVADVAQTTWLRLVENLPRIQDPERVGAWLATTATRESARVAQKARKQIVTDEVPERGADDDVAQRVVNAERRTALRSAFRRLRRRDQALLGLLVADPAPSYEQIGRILHMPVGSIGPTRARSLTRLRREAALFGIEELTPSTRRM